jgi:hypothetical protein
MATPPDGTPHRVGFPAEEQSKLTPVKRGSRMAVNVVRPSREGAAGPPLAGGPASRVNPPAWYTAHCWRGAEERLLL